MERLPGTKKVAVVLRWSLVEVRIKYYYFFVLYHLYRFLFDLNDFVKRSNRAARDSNKRQTFFLGRLPMYCCITRGSGTLRESDSTAQSIAQS